MLLQRLFDDKLRAVDFPRERCHQVRVVVTEDTVVRARQARGLHLRAVPAREVVERVLAAARILIRTAGSGGR